MRMEEVLDQILQTYEYVVVKKTWGETSLFFNPDKNSKHGAYFLTLKDSDGENDKASELSRDGIYRISFGVSKKTYEGLFGPKPLRPSKGGIVSTGHDFTKRNELMPHPIYAWMNWLQLLSPSRSKWNSVQHLVEESYELSAIRFAKR